MSPRREPRAIAESLRAVRARAEPRTLLGAAQTSWREAVGERIAREAQPVREREGVLTIACSAATWSQELDLLQNDLLERLNRELEPRRVEKLRFVVGESSGSDPL